MAIAAEYARTYEIIDISLLTPVNETHTHLIFCCPICESKRGKPDRDGKFYYSKTKNVGICFKCNTSFFPVIDEKERDTYDLKLAISGFLDRNRAYNQKFTEVGFKFDDLEVDILKYLKSRNPLLPQIHHLLGLKGWYGSNNGVVTPFIYDGKVCQYQVRFITSEKSKRYYTSPGEKHLYSPNHVFEDFKLKFSNTITLCEGTFDAIALMIMGYPNPIGILGSSLSEFQIACLRMISPETAFIAMDSFDISRAVQRQLRGLPSLYDTLIKTFDAKDPEEQLLYDIKTDKTKLSTYVNNIKEWTT